MNWLCSWKGLTRRTETQQVDPDSVLKVVFCQGADGFIIAECLQLPGCMSQGKTKEEANRNIVDAIKSVLMVRMGQLLSESAPHERNTGDPGEEESFRVKDPELVSC